MRWCVPSLTTLTLGDLERAFNRLLTDRPGQDDIVHAALTVEENLLFSTRYRLPSGTSHAAHLRHVECTLQAGNTPCACRPVVGSPISAVAPDVAGQAKDGGVQQGSQQAFENC